MVEQGRPAKKARPTAVSDVTWRSRGGAHKANGKGPIAAGGGAHQLTLKEINTDKLTKLARENWSSALAMPATASSAADAATSDAAEAVPTEAAIDAVEAEPAAEEAADEDAAADDADAEAAMPDADDGVAADEAAAVDVEAVAGTTVTIEPPKPAAAGASKKKWTPRKGKARRLQRQKKVKEKPPFNPALVQSIYQDELGGKTDTPPALKRVMLLEVSQYLENYLWPNFSTAASFEHIMSIVLMVNEKFREGVPAWTCFHTREDAFPDFFQRLLAVKAEQPDMRMHERTAFLVFTINMFQSLEDEMVRAQVLRLVSLPLWHALSPGRLQLELHAQPALAKHWKHLVKKEMKAAGKPGYVVPNARPESRFLPSLLEELQAVLNQVVLIPSSEPDEPATPLPATAAPPPGSLLDRRALLYCERFMELLTDLLSQLPTRRFVRALLEERAVLIKARMCGLYRHPGGDLFRQLVDLFQFYMSFPIDDHTGEPLSEDTVINKHYEKVCQLQRLAFKHWPQLRELALSNCGSVERRDVLRRHLATLKPEELTHLVTHQLRLVDSQDQWAELGGFLTEVVLACYERRPLAREMVNEMPLYPTERVLWDESLIPSATYNGDGCLALPKLNLQFLTPHDYLIRNFNLFRLEAAYEIREDVADVLGRVGAYYDDEGKVHFAGWARMALPIGSFRITEVRKPKIGEAKPSAITADIILDLKPLRPAIQHEWDETKQHDVLFLLTIRPPTEEQAAEMYAAAAAAAAAAIPDGEEEEDEAAEADTTPAAATPAAAGAAVALGGVGKGAATAATAAEKRKRAREVKRAAAAAAAKVSIGEKYGLIYVRGCEVIEVKDEAGKLLNDFTGRVRLDERAPAVGSTRTYTVALDAAQYQLDVNVMAKAKSEDVYATFNLLMRRKPKENNFKAVLESIRDLMNEDVIIPEWLRDIFLGYGDPAAAQYTNMSGTLRTLDFKDTFLDEQHVRDSFPGRKVTVVNNSGGPTAIPPFRITFPENDTPTVSTSAPSSAADGTNGHATNVAAGAGADPKSQEDFPELLVESYTPPNPGPYPQDQPRRNRVKFTPVQVEAIKSGVQPGLTMVVGPPGTGKTDTAVQIMHCLYHNCPGQRTLLITHSNQALNDLFTKIMERDVPERYLLRLGMGEQDLDTDQDFSRVGRVNAMLARRLQLLAEVDKMAKQFGVTDDVAYTCETSAHFWLLHVLSRWERFSTLVEAARPRAEAVAELFPFKEYFADAPQPVFAGRSFEQDMECARGCFRHLRTLFQELEECRAFELLKGQADRVNYLMTRQAKVVAMTCTHAALKRREFIDLAFKYDNLLMEEAAQILEIETFIPMLLQRQEDGHSRLKRVVLIGDHHQLPPVVKNMAFQKYSHLDQSLFTRFIRLGTPYVELNAQGRARSSLAKLYNWRYRQLGDLPSVLTSPTFLTANPGFAYEYQFVDVPDHQGKGETEPMPYFYQNLGEAEYLVSVFQFMRLMGYPANKISVLTTYNGQKALLRDVFERRCAGHPLFGRPYKVTTVDKYQGQQNDYILLSLVRSRVVGHLRDVRRLVVAMSRSRLGLYVFGRKALFGNCYELQPTFKQLLARPSKLALVKGESMGACTRQVGAKVTPDLIEGIDAMADLVSRITAEQQAAAVAALAAARQQSSASAPKPAPPITAPPSSATATAPDAATEALKPPASEPSEAASHGTAAAIAAAVPAAATAAATASVIAAADTAVVPDGSTSAAAAGADEPMPQQGS